ncbi:hypothetical protein KV699_24870 [Vreelandella titanicae]|jgi:hypothetical protein|uniref:hypothetical protein n=1 Tax=Halomonadaceae TaxID=28256 RepID=UPI00059B1CE0|nr:MULTISPECIES: hypothetical protein [Halomonas]KIN17111.1 hypothetical protein RO22_02045 [Halomonas sp. KHS3]MCD1585953.1 hypothetical protein [Halomonas sp. IOP_14]QNU63612.1 hypothetical protein HZS52_04440 [Halomonas titanicae]
MKTQITTIAAAIAVALSMGVSADPRDPNYDHDGNTFNGGKGVFDAQAGIRNGLNGYATTTNPNTRDSIILQNGGSDNVANATQKGTEQYSRIRQISDGIGNQAFVNQGLNGGNEQNESEVLQIGGENNLARVTQTGNLNDSYIRQTGTGDNTADVEQLNNTDSSDSVIFQDGYDNDAYVSQLDNSDTTWSHISQTGDGNYADVTQIRANNSASYIFQNGTEAHTATVVQRDESNSLSMIRQNTNMGGAAVATHTQVNGSNNYASSLQW